MAQAVLPARLTALLASWGADPTTVADAAADLLARYREPHRHYHSLEHIDEMLAVTDRLAVPLEVECATWFHDAIYQPSQPDNEARSGVYAHAAMQAVSAPRAVVDEVVRLVETTAQHDPSDGDTNAALLADADLAILGSAPERYARYVHDVRREYAHVADEQWQRTRATVLRSLWPDRASSTTL